MMSSTEEDRGGEERGEHIAIQKAIEQRLDTMISQLEGRIFNVKVSKEEVLGVILAKYCHWEGPRLLNITCHALEDANFHTEAALVEEIAKDLEYEDPADLQ